MKDPANIHHPGDIDDDDIFTLEQAIQITMQVLGCSREEAIVDVAAGIESGEIEPFEQATQ